jgi:23S rRNA (cytidine1920-2'-O)/16S rRNA (cytidine1409-2'-O)-methyltransferase
MGTDQAAKERIDKLLVERGLAESRTKAQAMVMAGEILVAEQRVSKPSEAFAANCEIRVKVDPERTRYVSRGGLKLEAALKEFGIDPTGWTCIDIGSSTGGFTDCLLQHGAKCVVAIDSGTNQLVWSLRTDPRVAIRENTNARHLDPGDFAGLFDLAVMDVSFISVTKVIPAVLPLLDARKQMVILIKPQFEVGKGEVGKGGIVREGAKHERVISDVKQFVGAAGLRCVAVIDSPITGAEGNKEFLAYFTMSPDFTSTS